MPKIEMLTDGERNKIRTTVEEYYELDEEGDLKPYLAEFDIVEGDVGFRCFPLPSEGPVEAIRFEIVVYDSASWKDESAGAFSDVNLRNGNTHYTQLSSELEDIIQEVTHESPDFIRKKGAKAFSCRVDV